MIIHIYGRNVYLRMTLVCRKACHASSFKFRDGIRERSVIFPRLPFPKCVGCQGTLYALEDVLMTGDLRRGKA